MGICSINIGKQSILSGIKHLNRLEQIIARSEWETNKISESIMLDTDGYVIEGTMSNIFGVKKNIFYTPILEYGGIEGVMRKVILNLLKKNKEKYKIKKIKLKEFLNFDEIFICNSIFGVWGVKKILKKKYKLGSNTKKIISFLSK